MRIYHPRLTALLWLLGMLWLGVLGVQALSRDWLETGFLALLPVAEQRPEAAKAIAQQNAQISKKLIWLAGGRTSRQAAAHAERLKQLLQQSGLFSNMVLQVPHEQYGKNYQMLLPYRYQLLDGDSGQTLLDDPQQLIRQNLEMLYSPLGQMQAASLERDPLLLFSRYFSAQNPLKLNLEQGVAVVNDGGMYWALLIADLEDQNLKLDKLESLLAVTETARRQLRAAGGELLATGMPLFTAHGSHSAQQEMSTVGLGSTLGLIALLLLTFRSPRPLLLSCLAVASGLFAALVLGILAFGKIHILTLVFGSSLIGEIVDFALHFFCDGFGLKHWTPRKGLRFVLPGISFGLFTSLLGYAGLGISPFPGLQEIAVFSAIGLIVSWLTVVWLFPLLLTGFNPGHQPLMLTLAAYWQQRWPLWLSRNRRWLSALLAIVLAGGIWRLTPQDDVRLLQSAPAQLMQTDAKIRTLLPVYRDNQFFLVTGKDQNEWYANEQRLLEHLQALQRQRALSHAEAISRYWPDAQMQQDNYRLLRQSVYGSGLLQTYMSGLGFSGEAITAELEQFKAAENKELSLAEWLSAADESKRQLWMGCDSGACRSIVTLSGIRDMQKLAALQNLPGVSWVDQAGRLSSMFERYRLRVSLMLLAACGLIVVVLGLRFGWRNALMITAVPVFAILASLAMLGWFDQLFSLFNVFALLLVLQVAVDYAIFFFMAEDKRDSTSLAVTLSALSTLLSFGLLATSSTEIVHAFGCTLAAGILSALLAAPLVGWVDRKS